MLFTNKKMIVPIMYLVLTLNGCASDQQVQQSELSNFDDVTQLSADDIGQKNENLNQGNDVSNNDQAFNNNQAFNNDQSLNSNSNEDPFDTAGGNINENILDDNENIETSNDKNSENVTLSNNSSNENLAFDNPIVNNNQLVASDNTKQGESSLGSNEMPSSMNDTVSSNVDASNASTVERYSNALKMNAAKETNVLEMSTYSRYIPRNDLMPSRSTLWWVGFDFKKDLNQIRLEILTRGVPAYDLFQEENQLGQQELIVRFYDTILRRKVRRDINTTEFRGPIAFIRMRADLANESTDVVITMRDAVKPRLFAKNGNILMTFEIPKKYLSAEPLLGDPESEAVVIAKSDVRPVVIQGSELPRLRPDLSYPDPSEGVFRGNMASNEKVANFVNVESNENNTNLNSNKNFENNENNANFENNAPNVQPVLNENNNNDNNNNNNNDDNNFDDNFDDFDNGDGDSENSDEKFEVRAKKFSDYIVSSFSMVAVAADENDDFENNFDDNFDDNNLENNINNFDDDNNIDFNDANNVNANNNLNADEVNNESGDNLNNEGLNNEGLNNEGLNNEDLNNEGLNNEGVLINNEISKENNTNMLNTEPINPINSTPEMSDLEGQDDVLDSDRSEYKPIRLEFRGAKLKEVIRALGDESETNFTFPSEIGEKEVYMSFRDVPWDAALRAVLETNGLGLVKLKGGVVRIDTLEKLAKEKANLFVVRQTSTLLIPTKVVVFKLSYAKADDVKTLFTSMLESSKFDKRVRVEVDKRTNSIIVEAIPTDLAKIKALVERIDLQTPQVRIQTRIVEVLRTNSNLFGINWAAPLNLDQSSGLGFGNVIFPGNMISKFAIDTGADANAQTGTAISTHFGSLNNSFELDLRLRMEETKGTTKILQNSNVMVGDNETAEINVGKQDFFTITSGTETSFTSVDYSLKVDVTPHITADSAVQMKVKVESSSPIEKTSPQAQASRAQKLVNTTFLKQSGETAAIGGLYTTEVKEGEFGIPILSDIPIIGALFRTKTKKDDRRELIVLVTPSIVNSAKAQSGSDTPSASYESNAFNVSNNDENNSNFNNNINGENFSENEAQSQNVANFANDVNGNANFQENSEEQSQNNNQLGNDVSNENIEENNQQQFNNNFE